MKTLFIFAFILLSNFIFAQPAGYNFGKHILIQSSRVSGTSNLTDFTLLVNVTDPDLRTTANGGNVQNVNGYDIVFTEGDCSTLLDHQIEKYDPVTGEYVVWVRIPSLSATTDYGIHMYYGNSSVSSDPSTVNAWDSDFEGIWHMNNDPSTSLLTDYSGNGVNGTSNGGMTTSDLVAGKIGDAIDFDGSNDYFALASKNYTLVSEITQISISAWVRTNFVSGSYSQNWSILDFDRSEYFNMYVHGDGRLGFSSSRGGIHDGFGGTSGDLNDNNWHHVVGVYDGTDKLYYIDGQLVLTATNPHGGAGIGDGPTRYGFIGDGSEATTFNGSRNNIYYDGMYDEIRFTTDVLSADRIQTEFNNQDSPSTFYTVSAEFTAATLCITLPVELLNFTVKPTRNKTVDLNWKTASEKDNDYFTVERSKDGLSWEALEIIKGAGNTSVLSNYSTTDRYPYSGTSYYRLKQTDFNGEYSYSGTRSILFEQSMDNLSIYPNPTNGTITIDCSLSETEGIRVINSLGQDVTHLITMQVNDQMKLVVDLSHLSTGLYLIKAGAKIEKVYKL